MSLRACRSCKILTEGDSCPICRGKDLSEDYTGLLIVLDPESELAKKLGVDRRGRYALKVR
ncbi:MAG: DNA-directed RNA polymerase, subunit E'' [Candidatus Bathyarchaeota archaeon B23]|nr:MAG: DNA-directed RNA polymerase, subunit E'' [Candidatus Bathyarchaeota archaeon B23]